MKSIRTLVVAATGVLLLLPAVAQAQGISGSRHDMSETRAAGSPQKDGLGLSDDRICNMCHTPHQSLTQLLLWTKAGGGPAGWTASTTLQGTSLPAAIGENSRRCLDCHDATVALGLVNNTGGGSSGTFAMTAALGAGYTVAPTGDMVNNHPVSIPYAGETYNTIVSGVPAGQVDGNIGNYWNVSNVSCEGGGGLCTDAAGGTLEGTKINLFDENGDGAAGDAGVECGTCHEPHNRYGNSYFLRVDVEVQSSLCRSCHNK